jgi:hypothetical protein
MLVWIILLHGRRLVRRQVWASSPIKPREPVSPRPRGFSVSPRRCLVHRGAWLEVGVNLLHRSMASSHCSWSWSPLS